MTEVNIYIATSVKSPKSRNGSVGFAIEWPGTNREPIAGIAPVQQMTANQSIMTALYKALWNVKKPSHIVIFTDSDYLKASLGWLPGWMESGWKRSDGKPVANWQAWETLAGKLQGHEVEFRMHEHHPYSNWFETNLQSKTIAKTRGC